MAASISSSPLPPPSVSEVREMSSPVNVQKERVQKVALATLAFLSAATAATCFALGAPIACSVIAGACAITFLTITILAHKMPPPSHLMVENSIGLKKSPGGKITGVYNTDLPEIPPNKIELYRLSAQHQYEICKDLKVDLRRQRYFLNGQEICKNKSPEVTDDDLLKEFLRGSLKKMRLTDPKIQEHTAKITTLASQDLGNTLALRTWLWNKGKYALKPSDMPMTQTQSLGPVCLHAKKNKIEVSQTCVFKIPVLKGGFPDPEAESQYVKASVTHDIIKNTSVCKFDNISKEEVKKLGKQ